MYKDRLTQQGGVMRVPVAHMEVTAPSIVDSLRAVVTDDGAAKLVCVPYFLSPGRHTTEDVPKLIAAAQAELAGEGYAAEIATITALGTQRDCILGILGVLVEGSLHREEELRRCISYISAF